MRNTKTRVAGLQALELSWREETESSTEIAATWLFRRGDALFRLDYVAEERWARTPAREGMESFLEGIGFAE